MRYSRAEVLRVSDLMWADFHAAAPVPDPQETPPDDEGFVMVMLTQPAWITLRDYYRLCGCAQCMRRLELMDDLQADA